jgi:hypothetical protein
MCTAQPVATSPITRLDFMLRRKKYCLFRTGTPVNRRASMKLD